MLFILVALFGALAYAFLQGTRTSTDWIENEQSKAEATNSLDCSNAVSMAVKRLEARGCSGLLSMHGDGSNDIVGAPTNGSCSVFHTNGGGVKKCGSLATCSSAELATLSIGEQCGGQIYAGVSPDNGQRMYAAVNDSGAFIWADLVGAGNYTTTNITNDDTGMANSTALLSLDADNVRPGSQSHIAAAYCRSLNQAGKSDWYLPARYELNVLYTNLSANGTMSPSGIYWSSTETNGWGCCAQALDFSSGSFASINKYFDAKIRCVRKE